METKYYQPCFFQVDTLQQKHEAEKYPLLPTWPTRAFLLASGQCLGKKKKEENNEKYEQLNTKYLVMIWSGRCSLFFFSSKDLLKINHASFFC